MCDLMTSAKAAAALHISEAKLHRLRMTGEIHHIDPGTGSHDIRFEQDDLNGYLEWAEREALQKFRDRLRTRMRNKYPTTNYQGMDDARSLGREEWRRAVRLLERRRAEEHKAEAAWLLRRGNARRIRLRQEHGEPG